MARDDDDIYFYEELGLEPEIDDEEYLELPKAPEGLSEEDVYKLGQDLQGEEPPTQFDEQIETLRIEQDYED